MPQFRVPARITVQTEVTVEAKDVDDALHQIDEMNWVDSGLNAGADILYFTISGTPKPCS